MDKATNQNKNQKMKNKAQNMEHIRQRYGSERFTSDGHRADLIHA